MPKYFVELNSKRNERCRLCTTLERDKYQEEDLCREATSVEDGLPVRCVGNWAYDKIYHLVQYLSSIVIKQREAIIGRGFLFHVLEFEAELINRIC
jgi:hypothetical protein